MWGSRSATATPFACHLRVSTLLALLLVLSLLGFVAGCLVRSSARQTHPRRDKSGQTQIAKAQLQFLFPVGKELAKVAWFFFKLSAFDFPRTADPSCDGAVVGPLLRDVVSALITLLLVWGRAPSCPWSRVCWDPSSTRLQPLGGGKPCVLSEGGQQAYTPANPVPYGEMLPCSPRATASSCPP